MQNVARKPIVAALRTQATACRTQADTLDATADALEADTSTTDDYLTQNTAPIGKRRFLAAATRGDFPTSKVGKLVLVKRTDFVAWLGTSSRAIPQPVDSEHAALGSDEDLLRSRLGLRVVGGRR